MSGLLTITGLSGAGPSYTLTVTSSTGVAIANHVVAPLVSDPSHGGIYRVTAVPTGTTIDIQDDLVPGGGAYGAPATSGPGSFWTPTTGGVSTNKANNTPFWGDITERDTETNELGGGGGGHAAWVQDEFTATAAQVTFILTGAPTEALSLTFNVNGIDYDDVVDFTISGTTITWTNAAFVMGTDDKVIVRYY